MSGGGSQALAEAVAYAEANGGGTVAEQVGSPVGEVGGHYDLGPGRRAARLRRMSGAPHRVLVVDDEPSIVDVIGMALRFQGFEVESAGTGSAALAAVPAFRPDLIVLDVMLPDMEGFDVAERLGARQARVPIVFLTARDATQDKIRGLTLGGDDYVTKPFSLEELIARIRSILRRSGLAEPESSRLAFEDLELDEDAHEVSRAGRAVELTATEYRLLRYLLLNPRRVLTRGQLLEHVWEYDFGGDARILETYVSDLRRKLGDPPLIHTVRGVGYVLRSPRT
jgi:two-component system OmpR family response regulator